MKIFISNNPESLKAKLDEFEHTATVEAEYGDTVVEGSVLTLAHHGPRKVNPCPCMLDNLTNTKIDAIGISHCDADTLGGIRAILDRKSAGEQYPGEATYGFWYAMSRVDVLGPHHFSRILNETQKQLNIAKDHDDPYENVINRNNIKSWAHAFWAWSEKNRLYAPRDGSVEDVTEKIMWMQFSIDEIFKSYAGDDGLRDAGDSWNKAQVDLTNKSFLCVMHNDAYSVVLRQSEQFVNHLYINTSGADGQILAVVSSNPKTFSVTVSIADPLEGFSCGEFVKELWGDTAGGHAGIGGSPREGFGSADNAEREAYKAFTALFKTLTTLTNKS